MKDQYIVFAYWVDGELQRFRADTFGTISKTHPKIYTYSESQVKTVLKNTKDSLNYSGSYFLNKLFENNVSSNFDKNDAVEHIHSNENTLRNWKNFELRVHLFKSRDELDEEWKMNIAINNLEPAFEIHNFQIIDNEN